MSTYGVESRMREAAKVAMAENNGVISGEAFRDIVEYANNGPFTDGEREALLNPHEYLARARGVDVAALTFSSEAWSIAEGLVAESGLSVFPNFAAEGSGTQPTPAAPTETNLREAYAAALARGKDLGSFEDWKVKTAGADVSFKTEGSGQAWPALVIDKVQFSDPEPRDLVGENADKLNGAKTSEELKTAIKEIVDAESAYFGAEGVDVKNVNEGFGISSLRRKAFISALRSHVSGLTGFSAEDKVSAKGVVEGANIELATGRDFEMKVGSHTNYWPYWNNYLAPLEKMLGQTEEGTASYDQIMNRIRDIHRRKTATGRSISERDFEKSIGMALIHSPNFSEGVGHRVSVVDGSTPFSPKYELLSVASEGLPEGFEAYAGMQVVRNSDGKLIADYMGEGDSEVAKLAKTMVGKEIPEELASKVDAKALSSNDLADLNMRDFVTGESSRKDISMDWDSNGAINVANISISWWGHCHNEAPLNAMDIDPQKGVSVYRADRGVDAASALVRYSAEDAWDVAGAFVSDHESGYAVGNTGNTTRVDETSFVGIRNDGKNTFTLAIPGTSIDVDAELVRMTKDSEPVDTKAIFRSNVEKDDGTFEKNPLYVSTDARESDLITVNVDDAQLTMKSKYIGFDSSGYRTEQTSYIQLDPTEDKFIKLSESISKLDPSGLGGEIVEHFYNAKTKEYHSVTKEVNEANGFEPTQVGEPSANVAVSGLTHTSETEFDSAKELFDFYMENPGMPKTYDTSSGKSVWNYPVNEESMDLTNEVTKVENGQTFTYRTFNLKYTTMGGPGGDSTFILKYNSAGKVVDTAALDPMPDFVYRNDHWVSAPVTTDVSGRTSFNVKALNKGYLLREGGNSYADIETSLWKMEATVLYASMTDETAEGHAYIFETADGKVISFSSQEDFDSAVEADKKLRTEEASQ